MTTDLASLRGEAERSLARLAEEISVAEEARERLERRRGRYCAELAERLSLREIAELAGVGSHNTVKQWIERARGGDHDG